MMNRVSIVKHDLYFDLTTLVHMMGRYTTEV